MQVLKTRRLTSSAN
jgi:hypothetical protein